MKRQTVIALMVVALLVMAVPLAWGAVGDRVPMMDVNGEQGDRFGAMMGPMMGSMMQGLGLSEEQVQQMIEFHSERGFDAEHIRQMREFHAEQGFNCPVVPVVPGT